ncbi:MAG: lytic transglycosylase domain-containing protein, partial [Myxococcota bacterium]|nr:lytic transglycosylase domain-containing protein [Myxococcota bacterium]
MIRVASIRGVLLVGMLLCLLGIPVDGQASEPVSTVGFQPNSKPVPTGSSSEQFESAGKAERRRSSLQARITTRSRLLDRIRRQGDDPSTCFLPRNPALPEPLVLAPDSTRSADALLTSILRGLQPEEVAPMPRLVEKDKKPTLPPVLREKVANFGAVDHLIHPSTDVYTNPVRAMSGRPNLHLELVDAADFDYPVVLNTKVQNWMVFLLTRGRKHFVKWLARAERYEPLITPRLEEAGLPKDLLYQAMIESGFNPYATSRASAVGVWQFIASTGRAYGLERNWWVDERRDPEMATRAAIEFMSHLYRRFDSWEIASAAYNAGGGKLSKAIRTYETDDYWELASSDRDFLASETKNYVPKMIA